MKDNNHTSCNKFALIMRNSTLMWVLMVSQENCRSLNSDLSSQKPTTYLHFCNSLWQFHYSQLKNLLNAHNEKMNWKSRFESPPNENCCLVVSYFQY